MTPPTSATDHTDRSLCLPDLGATAVGALPDTAAAAANAPVARHTSALNNLFFFILLLCYASPFRLAEPGPTCGSGGGPEEKKNPLF